MALLFKFEYPALPPPAFSPNSRCHWSVKHRVGREVQDEVALLLRLNGWDGTVYDQVTIKVRFGLPDKKRRDLDNLIAASKPILDALPLADDNVRRVKVEYDWFDSHHEPKTLIEIRNREV